ncbi:MAG: dihydropteroate synthase [Prevotella sp.]|nr:dihydropteroate synthase [Prevotella sp.]
MDFSINIGGRLLSLESPLVMGILNCTPDSFFSGSRKQTEREIAERAQQIVAEGGRMIDVGAFSTRPGAAEVPIDEELRRLQSALQIVRREVPDAIVSVDTYRPLVARRCVEEWGANIVNDVSEGGRTGIVGVAIREEESMFATVAQLGVPYILMSVQPTIESMLKSWADDVLQLRELGQKDIILDPGFGFGKTVDENYAVMGEMEKLAVMELPLLVGVSRKSMIWKLLDGDPETALNGTTALNAIALLKGAKILRVHDVKEAVETVKIVGKCSPHPSSPNRGRSFEEGVHR